MLENSIVVKNSEISMNMGPTMGHLLEMIRYGRYHAKTEEMGGSVLKNSKFWNMLAMRKLFFRNTVCCKSLFEELPVVAALHRFQL